MEKIPKPEESLAELYENCSDDDSLAHLAKVAGLAPETDFEDSDLRNLRVRGEDLTNFSFRGADLSGSDLREAKLRFGALVGANLSRAKTQGIVWMEPDLQPPPEILPSSQIPTPKKEQDKYSENSAANLASMIAWIAPIDEELGRVGLFIEAVFSPIYIENENKSFQFEISTNKAILCIHNTDEKIEIVGSSQNIISKNIGPINRVISVATKKNIKIFPYENPFIIEQPQNEGLAGSLWSSEEPFVILKYPHNYRLNQVNSSIRIDLNFRIRDLIIKDNSPFGALDHKFEDIPDKKKVFLRHFIYRILARSRPPINNDFDEPELINLISTQPRIYHSIPRRHN